MTQLVRLLDSAAMRDALIAAVREGIPLVVAWRAAGYNPSIYQDWKHAAAHGAWRNGYDCPPDSLAIIQDFVERVEQARAECEAELVGNLMTAARERNEKTGLLDWRPNAWILEHSHARERWFAHHEQGVTPPPPRPQHSDLATMAEADLLEVASPMWKEILTPRQPAQLPAPTGDPDPQAGSAK